MLARLPSAMPFRAPVLRRSLPALVVVALLFAQALGLLHGVLHAPLAGAGAPPHASVPELAQPDAPRVLADVFSHEADEPTCRLFDALACGGALAAQDRPADGSAPSVEPVLAQQAPHAAPGVHFDARGPPALS